MMGLSEPFYILVSTLLALLLPLSFLLLSRTATENYLFTLRGFDPLFHNSSLVFSELVFLTTRPIINRVILFIVSILSIASLGQSLVHKLVFPAPRSLHSYGDGDGDEHEEHDDHDHGHESPGRYSGARLCASWVLLCLIQVCVGIGTKGSVASGVEYGGSKGTTGSLTRLLLFLGVHETMLYWWRIVVKPVVDETVYGGPRTEERWVERAAVAASFGGLWWWRLSDEVEAMVGVVDAKKVLFMEIGVSDFVGWWLYYLTVTIGIVKVVKSGLWVGIILLFERRAQLANPDHILLWHNYRDLDDGHELKV